ncbi:MAG: AAA-like domain-containing protein [Fibromonadaceae bacterium]|jgi:hypothetical protein|nr:AAA-like domain-containing protein [Fibromonadaceae bacterium]
MREFNVTGLCVPSKHYMADTSEKIRQIAAMVEKGHYFTINRGRQYGKTTTLALLENQLPEMGYSTIFVSFEGVDDRVFESPENFCQGILNVCSKYFTEKNLPGSEVWVDSSVTTFDLLDTFLNKTCENKKIVLMIDEVDKTSNNFIFLKFLGLLRDKYLKRGRGAGATFQSVILAGVYDIKNLKLKMIQAGTHQLQDGEKRINSPWNIAIDFKVDMSLNEKEIAPMLTEYEKEHSTGMDIEAISKEIRAYTNGYPYLVSRICQCIESELERDWTHNGILNAIKIILVEQSTLFDDIAKNIKSNPDLKELLRELTVGKRMRSYNVDNDTIQLALTFGIIENRSGLVAIHNRIFEIRITNYFISEREEVECRAISSSLINMVRDKDNFDMPLFLEKFANHYYEIYNNKDIKFLERECRLLFVTYLKPYINGAGNYYLESETRDSERTDVIIDYGSEQFIVELKLWYGEVAHENALDQIANYLDSKNKDIGYLLTFDFRKEQNVGKPQIRWVEHRGKKILDVMVGV